MLQNFKYLLFVAAEEQSSDSDEDVQSEESAATTQKGQICHYTIGKDTFCHKTHYMKFIKSL